MDALNNGKPTNFPESSGKLGTLIVEPNLKAIVMQPSELYETFNHDTKTTVTISPVDKKESLYYFVVRMKSASNESVIKFTRKIEEPKSECE